MVDRQAVLGIRLAVTMPTRPFHKTVIGLINSIDLPAELCHIANFLIATKLPKNHDAVIEAWRQRLAGSGLDDAQFGVIPFLEEQKREAEEKALYDKLSLLAGRVFWAGHEDEYLFHNKGLVFVYQVCEKTRDELLPLLGDDVVRAIEGRFKDDYGQVGGLRLGMTLTEELLAKLHALAKSIVFDNDFAVFLRTCSLPGTFFLFSKTKNHSKF